MNIAALRPYRHYLILLVVDSLFFGLFSPSQSSWLLLPGFALLIATIYGVFTLLVRLMGKFITIKAAMQKKITVFGTFVIGVILALQSLGQLTPKDIITVIPLLAVLYLYISYFTLKRQ